MTNFNYWWIIAPLMLVGAFAIGWFSIGLKGCKWHARRWADFVYWPYAILSAVGFGLLLFVESYLGFVQMAFGVLNPYEDSVAWADVIAYACIVGSAMVFFFLLFTACALGDTLKRKRLKHIGGRKRRAYCRSISREDAIKACPYSCDKECPCGIDRRLQLNLSDATIMNLVNGLQPLFERQIAAGKVAECSLMLPIIDGQISLSRDELSELQMQAYELSQALPDCANLRIKRSLPNRARDRFRVVYRRTRATVRAAFGLRSA